MPRSENKQKYMFNKKTGEKKKEQKKKQKARSVRGLRARTLPRGRGGRGALGSGGEERRGEERAARSRGSPVCQGIWDGEVGPCRVPPGPHAVCSGLLSWCQRPHTAGSRQAGTGQLRRGRKSGAGEKICNFGERLAAPLWGSQKFLCACPFVLLEANFC